MCVINGPVKTLPVVIRGGGGCREVEYVALPDPPLLTMIGADRAPDKEQLTRVMWAGDHKVLCNIYTHKQVGGYTPLRAQTHTGP